MAKHIHNYKNTKSIRCVKESNAVSSDPRRLVFVVFRCLKGFPLRELREAKFSTSVALDLVPLSYVEQVKPFSNPKVQGLKVYRGRHAGHRSPGEALRITHHA